MGVEEQVLRKGRRRKEGHSAGVTTMTRRTGNLAYFEPMYTRAGGLSRLASRLCFKLYLRSKQYRLGLVLRWISRRGISVRAFRHHAAGTWSKFCARDKMC